MSGNGSRRALHFDHPPRRVVSLVPSMTESMFELGLGESVVGITDYCVYPQDQLSSLPRVGGPKNPRLPEILALQPDLVLANQEENTQAAIEALETAGLPVWMTFPHTVQGAMDVLWTLAGIFGSRLAAIRLETLEITLDWARSAAEDRQPVRYFCPIWFDTTAAGQPWFMTFNRETYCHDLLELAGGANIFADRRRRYPLDADLGLIPAQDPGEKDTRYPRVTIEEVLAAQPELILLPDEPFAFSQEHQELIEKVLADTPAAQGGRIHRLDGSLITWHGTRLARALQELPSLFQ